MRKIGTIVKVKRGHKIPGLNIDMTGWRGRIIDRKTDRIMGLFYVVEWDSKTLNNIGFKTIYRMHKHGIDWTKDFFTRGSIVKADERDTVEDVHEEVTLLKELIKNKDERLA